MSGAEHDFVQNAGQVNPAAASQELVSSTDQPKDARPSFLSYSFSASLNAAVDAVSAAFLTIWLAYSLV